MSRHGRGYLATWAPQTKTLALLLTVDRILEQYRDFLPLTCRQIFYRLVAAYAFPKTENAYASLCETMATARRARRLSFDAIRDDSVNKLAYADYTDTDDFHRKVRSMAKGYTRNKLARQPTHIEVLTEAAGIGPQLARETAQYSVPVFSSGGFDSLTAKWNMAQRIVRTGKPTVILHVGDLDPSGVALFEAVAEDVRKFVLADRQWLNVDVEFIRVALTPEQVDEFGLDTAPAKVSSHSKRWGDAPTCQLEALAPDDLAELVRDAIWQHFDSSIYDEDEAAELLERRQLTALLPPPRNDR